MPEFAPPSPSLAVLWYPCRPLPALPNTAHLVAGDKVDKVILISDIFGIYNNCKLVADEWAGQGYEVYVPDLLEGSKVDEGLLNVSVE